MRQGTRLALAGSAAGMFGGLVLSRAMQRVLFALRAADPMSFLAAAALLVIVALTASYIPARPAMRVDPMVAL